LSDRVDRTVTWLLQHIQRFEKLVQRKYSIARRKCRNVSEASAAEFVADVRENRMLGEAAIAARPAKPRAPACTSRPLRVWLRSLNPRTPGQPQYQQEREGQFDSRRRRNQGFRSGTKDRKSWGRSIETFISQNRRRLKVSSAAQFSTQSKLQAQVSPLLVWPTFQR
jgi:hypothetical protein